MDIVEEKVAALEVRGEFRTALSEEIGGLRGEFHAALTEPIAGLGTHMMVLHEDLVARFALIQEGVNGKRRRPKRG